MSTLLQRLSLPLLAKDLVETANRRRTYILRMVYAILLYFFTWLIYIAETSAMRMNSIDLLGTGDELLTPAIFLQFAGICLFMPALSAGAITIEKERNTLTLLFLTRLGPWTILLEKYLARVVNMLSYLLISLPLLGLAYSLGGVMQIDIWTGVCTLVLMVVQVAAISIACSAFFHSTMAAFIWTYLCAIGLYFTPMILNMIIGRDWVSWCSDIAQDVVNSTARSIQFWYMDLLTPLFTRLGWTPQEIVDWQTFRPMNISWNTPDAWMWTCPLNLYVANGPPGRSMGTAGWHLGVRSLPILLTTGIHLVLARYWLVRRATAPTSNKVMSILRWFDQVFHRLNQNRFTQGKVLIQDSQVLPDYEPISWRETRKRAFGTVRYLVRFLVIIELPIAMMCIMAIITTVSISSYRHRHEFLSEMSMMAWALSTLFLISKAATVLPSERMRETFDVLLSTPMSAREIVQQKFAGIRRLIWVLSVPLLTLIVSHALLIQTSVLDFWDPRAVGWYLIAMIGVTLVYPRMIAWLSILVGLKIKSQTKAIFVTLALVIAWIVVPILCLFIWDEVFNMPLHHDSQLAAMAFSQSPAFLIIMAEANENSEVFITAILTTLIEYSLITLTLRAISLRFAARMLGRPETI